MTGQLQQAVCSFPKEETVYRVLITDAPQPKEHTYLCQALLKERRDTAGRNQQFISTLQTGGRRILL